jgi:SAM-dependent methyltransferase
MLAESVNFIELVNEEFKIKEPVLDIGSKIRRKDYCRTSVKKILNGKDCVGLDIERGWGVDMVGDAHKLPFEDKSIGTVFMIETIEHLWEPTRAMREISRVIVPGGILAFTAVWVFNKPMILETERRYLGVCYPIHHKNDWWRFSDWSIGRLLRENDFKLISLTPTMARAFVIARKRKTPYKKRYVCGGLVN